MGGGHSTNTTDTELAGIQLQTSNYGDPLPIVYGTTRIPGKLLDYDDFTAIPHTTTQQVGKGGGGSSMSNTTYTYTAGVLMALCEGPISGVNQVWRDKDIGSLSTFGLSLLTGTRPQSPWATWVSKHPSKAVGYAGFAQVANAAMDLGSSGSLKNHSFEVTGFLGTEQDPSAPTAYDAKPASILPDFITNTFYGAAPGFALADLVTGAASYATYCTACGFALSPAFDEQKAAADHIQDMLDATNSEAVWTAGATGMLLKVVPYGDQPVTANGATYTPNTTPLYDLTYDDFLGVVDKTGKPTGNDAITVTRSSTQDVMNCVPVEFWDRLNSYNASVVDDPDPVDVAQNGLKKDQPKAMHMITRAPHALQISRILAQRNVYVRNTYTFKVGWKYILLEPLDLVTLTDPKLGLNKKIVRIISVEMPDETAEEDGLTITAEEWPFGTGTGTLYSTQIPSGTVPNVNADPGNANVPVVFDVPMLFSQSGGPEVMIGASGGAIWGGCDVYVSADGSTYNYQGTISAKARHGVLTAIMPMGSQVQDTTSTAQVDLSTSGGALQSVAAQVATDLQSLCWCDGEFFSYQNATLTGANRYTLGTLLVRGAYGTTQMAHNSGKAFVRVDSALLRIPVPASRIGQTLYIKLVSFNQWGGGKQSLANVSPITYTPAGQYSPAPSNVIVQVAATPFI